MFVCLVSRIIEIGPREVERLIKGPHWSVGTMTAAME